MRALTDNLFTVMKRLDGCKFKGFVTTPFGFKQDDMYNRVLFVKNPSPVKLGDVIYGPGNTKLLLMEHPDDEEWNTNFRVGFVNSEYTWERTIKVLDPVARVLRDFQNTPMGVIHAYFDQPLKTQIGSMQDTKYSFYTGEDVQEGDIVGGKIVKKIVYSMGVRLVSVE